MKKKISIHALCFLCLVFVLGAFSSASDLSLLTVHPNPARRFRGENMMTFDHIPGAKISIYSVQGALVVERHLDDGENSFAWNLKNDSGTDVASGVYIYLISSGGDETSGKIAVIR